MVRWPINSGSKVTVANVEEAKLRLWSFYFSPPLGMERTRGDSRVRRVGKPAFDEAKLRLTKSGYQIVKDEPEFPRCYIRDPFGLIYNPTT